jgi:excisionase family DNA binding protein
MPERLLTYRQAAEVLGITERALRTEARRGRLRLVKLAGKHYVTPSALDDLIAAATVPASSPCHVDDCQPDSICAEPEEIAQPSGSLSTERKSLALAQAQMTVQRLKQRSRNISRSATDHRQEPIAQINSSSPK